MKKVNVFGMVITIRREPCVQHGYVGIFQPAQNLIILDADLKGQDLIQTEIHEFLHAVFHRMALNQTSINGDLQEIIVDSMATALVENYKIKSK